MTRTTNRASALLMAFVLGSGLVGPALAQKAGPNGGSIYVTDGHGAEIVLRPAELAIHLSHDGKPSDTAGYTLKAVVQQGGKTMPIALKDSEGKRFVGVLAAPLEKGAIVVITGRDHHGHAVTARHVVK